MKRTDRYQIVETIQEGMAAVTYKAHDRVLDRTVLLKVLHTRLAADVDLVQRFRREALLQARLKHPGVVTVYDFGTEDDFYIASEFVEGRTLDKLLAEKGRLRVDELAPILQAVARALAYAHAQGVIHRDLKPANIMIADSGDVKLTDFGLACARDFGELTQEGCVIGTPSYMSPEQARGLKVGPATDIFALGVVVYQALSGVNPFAAPSYAEALSLVLNHRPRPLSEVVAGLPPGLGEFVGRMIAKSAAERPGSAEELTGLLSAPT
ncbi:serine/threonine protein kinase, partial [candidate division WOR-3 bacterium]|nr:serine/threonine protein kinase [candidate division WOR-3 bacterium]